MENRIVEVVEGGLNRRNNVMTYIQYLDKVKDNAFKKEMYRSYYLFDTTFGEHVIKHKSVKNYSGLIYPDRIIIDIDKGDIDDEALQSYLRHTCNELFDYGIDLSLIHI